jgi:hypothetical protein
VLSTANPTANVNNPIATSNTPISSNASNASNINTTGQRVTNNKKAANNKKAVNNKTVASNKVEPAISSTPILPINQAVTPVVKPDYSIDFLSDDEQILIEAKKSDVVENNGVKNGKYALPPSISAANAVPETANDINNKNNTSIANSVISHSSNLVLESTSPIVKDAMTSEKNTSNALKNHAVIASDKNTLPGNPILPINNPVLPIINVQPLISTPPIVNPPAAINPPAPRSRTISSLPATLNCATAKPKKVSANKKVKAKEPSEENDLLILDNSTNSANNSGTVAKGTVISPEPPAVVSKYTVRFKCESFEKDFHLNDKDPIESIYISLFGTVSDRKLLYEGMKLSRFLTAEEVGFFPGLNYINLPPNESLPFLETSYFIVKINENIENDVKIKFSNSFLISELIQNLHQLGVKTENKSFILNGERLKENNLIKIENEYSIDLIENELLEG